MIGAIIAGMSCRAAAARFGIGPSVAVKWRRLWLETGSVAARAQGGDTRSGRIEAVGGEDPAMVAEAPDITLVEITDRLERGQRFAPSTVHRFFRRHGWSFKKRPATPASRTARTSPRHARSGSRRSRTWTPSG